MPVVRHLVATLILVALTGIAVVAQPAPVGAQPYGAGSTEFADLPVQVQVDRLSPATPPTRPDGVLTVAGWLHNTGPEDLSDLDVRLGIGNALQSRSALAQADADPPSASRDFTPEQELPATLAEGESTRFTYRVPVSELSASLTGVYPLQILVQQGSDRSVSATVGAAQTFLPWFSEVPSARTGTAWLWPLATTPVRRTDDGSFADDRLAKELEPEGRLGVLLATARSQPARSLTVAVDPDLVETVEDMMDGYQVQNRPGTGTADARSWLAGLRALSQEQDVVVLPYGDIDTVAAVRAGLAADVTAAAAYGTQVLQDSLEGSPTAQVSWPADGLLTRPALDVEIGRGVQTIVLSDAALSSDEPLTQQAATDIPTLAGTVTGVAYDEVLASLVSVLDTYPGGLVMARQRLLSEVAMITAEAPGDARNILLVPPRHWDAGESVTRMSLAATRAAPWARSTLLRDIVSDDARAERQLEPYPPEAVADEVDATVLEQVGRAQARIAEFSTVLSPDDVPTVLGPLQREVWRAQSNAWRADDTGAAAYTRSLTSHVDLLYGSVRIASGGKYTLSGQESQIPVTVANDLPVAATVSLTLSSAPNSGFTASDSGTLTVPRERRETVEVPVRLDKPGRYTVIASLETPAGVPLGTPSELSVRSTAYGGLVAGLTIGALVLFVLLAAVRFVRLRRTASEDDRGRPRPR